MGANWEQTLHYLILIFPVCAVMFLFFMIGLWISWWLWGKGSRLSVRSFTQLCSTIEEQQDLLIEQQVRVKRLVDRVRIAEETMKVHLGPNVATMQQKLEKLEKLEKREKEIERLSALLEGPQS